MSHSHPSVNLLTGKLVVRMSFVLTGVLLVLLSVQSAIVASNMHQRESLNLNHSLPALLIVDDSSKWAGPGQFQFGNTNKIVSCDWSEDKRGNLTYHIKSYPKQLKGKEKTVAEVFAKAFEHWSALLFVNFWPKEQANATFEIKFVSEREDDDYIHGTIPDYALIHIFERNGTRVIRFKDDGQWTSASNDNTRIKWAEDAIGDALRLEDDSGLKSVFHSTSDGNSYNLAALSERDRAYLMFQFAGCSRAKKQKFAPIDDS